MRWSLRGPGRAGPPSDTTTRLLAGTRRRLALITLGLLVALLTAVGVTTGVLATRSLDASVDRSLEVAATAAAERAGETETGEGSGEGSGDQGPETDHPPEAADTFFLYLDRSGALVSNPQLVALAGLPDRAAATSALANGRDLRTLTAGGVRVRLLTLRVTSDDSSAGAVRAVQAGFVLTLRDEQARDLLVAIATVVAAGLLGAALVTLVVTTRALWPIRSAFERERRFVAAASHELRTPAALIRGTAEVLLREGHVDPGGQAFVADIVAEADRMGALVGELAELASAQSRPPEPRRPVDLGDVVNDVVHRAAPIATAAGLTLHAGRASTDAVRVLGARDRIVQVALILIDNAVRHAPAGSRITVEAAVAGSTGLLAVTDQGPGIPVAERERVFEPFAQLAAHGSPRQPASSGLGLAIARAIVDRMGGSIRVEDAPGGGARFSVSLPLG